MKKRIRIFIVLVLIFASSKVFAMSSDNYQINADIIGSSGGSSSSDNYGLRDTLGEPIIGIGSSLNYQLQQGFQYMINTGISLTVDSNTKDLGSVNPGSSVQGQSTIGVTTDSWGGYDLMISENHSLLHGDASTTINDYSCSIESPCAWSGYGFGFTVTSGTDVESKWGSSPDFNYAAVPLTDSIFHSKGGYLSGLNETAAQYNVAPTAAQKSGTYSNIILYTALAKL